MGRGDKEMVLFSCLKPTLEKKKMCCFSNRSRTHVDEVGNTRILIEIEPCRTDKTKMVVTLTYAMKMKVKDRTTMIVPLFGLADDERHSVVIKEGSYARLEEVAKKFQPPRPEYVMRGGASRGASPKEYVPPLPVFRSGDYLHSTVPTIKDIDRLDPNVFIVDPELLILLKAKYPDEAFAVFTFDPPSSSRVPFAVDSAAIASLNARAAAASAAGLVPSGAVAASASSAWLAPPPLSITSSFISEEVHKRPRIRPRDEDENIIQPKTPLCISYLAPIGAKITVPTKHFHGGGHEEALAHFDHEVFLRVSTWFAAVRAVGWRVVEEYGNRYYHQSMHGLMANDDVGFGNIQPVVAVASFA